MKKSKIVVVLLAMICMLCGCVSEQPPQKPEEPQQTEKPEQQEQEKPSEMFPYQDDQMYAVAYLAYDETAAADYLKDADIPVHHISDGEYYLVIPRYDNMKMELYQTDIETMETKTLVYEEDNAKPFILQCNISDIFADATVCFTYEDQLIEFTPYISLKDGSVIIGDRGLDITK